MYLTAQRVSAPGDVKTGINTFLSRHNEQVPTIDWKTPDLARIVDEFPGTLTSSHIEVPPGGNLVRSYLDIVTGDSTSPETISQALKEFERELTASRLSQVVQIAGVAIRLGMEMGRESRATEEFRDLSEHVLALLRNPAWKEWQAQGPLRVVAKTDGNEHTYVLDESSIVRLRSIHGPDWRPARS